MIPQRTTATGESQERWCLSCNHLGQRESRCEGGWKHLWVFGCPHSRGRLILGTSPPFEISIHDSRHFHNTNALKPFFSKVAFHFLVPSLSLLSATAYCKCVSKESTETGAVQPFGTSCSPSLSQQASKNRNKLTYMK